MSFVNTVDTELGEAGTLDALIAQTLEELNDDRVTSLRQYALYYNNGLKRVCFPNLETVAQRAFRNCANLEVVDIKGGGTINANAFQSCSKLKHLILRNTSGITTLSNTNAISAGKFSSKGGAIWVPRDLVASYKTANNWSTYAQVILPLDEYPNMDFSTIPLSWSQIKAAVEDESFFSASYAVGDMKKLTYGTHEVYMEIRKIDTTNKFVDFVVVDFDETTQMGNSMKVYAETTAYSRLNTIYNDELPSDLKTAITPVAKKYYNYQGNTDEVTVPLWLLNTKDAGLTGSYLKDSEGEDYFSTDAQRVKRNAQTGSAYYWWLGSAYYSSYFVYVGDYGGAYSNYPNSSYGLVFGFRIKKS